MKRIITLSACVLFAAISCNRQPLPEGPSAIRFIPVITKATDTDFENSDAIGVTITRESGVYADNAQFTYNGNAFEGNLKWYNESTDPATIKAYYPYAAAAPATFTVATDQSAGTAASDFIAAVKENVLPSADAIVLPFQHKLTSLLIQVVNNSGSALGDFTIKGIIPVAVIADDFSAQADAQAEAVAIKAFQKAEGRYTAIVPPQTAVLEAATTVAGKEVSQKLKEATLLGGKQYTISVIVNPADMEVVLSGDIADWENGGDLDPDNEPVAVPFEEHLSEGYFLYDNVQYSVVKMKEYGNEEGRWWMAQNLAFIPAGYTPCTESDKALTPVDAGVYAPLVKGEGALVFSTDPEVVQRQGYLYQSEVALGLKVGDITSVEQAQALEGAQGICPPGWHIPTVTEYVNLIGKMATYDNNNTNAPYYDTDKANATLAKLDEDNFNINAWGAVSIQNNAATTVSQFMGYNASYEYPISGFYCGSSFAGTSTNNFQFWGLMPMRSNGTCNGSKLSYRIAASVRCVRNAE